MLHKRKMRKEAELDLERQYWSMNKACEELRLIGENGMTGGKDEGRLFRIAMRKEGIWQGVPIEYARMQTEWPARDGWNHEWTRN
jgi:large subunit ribosomal protein L40